MPQNAQTTGAGGPPPEPRSVLGFPVRPGGDGRAVQAGRVHWYQLAEEIHGVLGDLDRVIAGLQWSGDARTAFDARWSQLSGHGTEAVQHSHEMGDHLLSLGRQIEDAQHEWDLAMAAMTASAAIGIGLTFVTFGVSDAIAEGAATAAVGAMETACTTFEITLDAAVQMLRVVVDVVARLGVKLTWQFSIDVVGQETANVVQGRGMDKVDLLQAAEFAGVSTVIPGLAGKLTIGDGQALNSVTGAVLTGAATDATIQGLEGVTEDEPFNVGEVVASGALAGGGQRIAAAFRRSRRSGQVAPEDGGLPNVLPLSPADVWGNPVTLARHFADHGADFGAVSADEYAIQASWFLQRGQAEGMPTKVDNFGVIRTYDVSTNEFGSYNPDGTARTYFAPDPACHGYSSNWDYWLSQPGMEPWTP